MAKDMGAMNSSFIFIGSSSTQAFFSTTRVHLLRPAHGSCLFLYFRFFTLHPHMCIYTSSALVHQLPVFSIHFPLSFSSDWSTFFFFFGLASASIAYCGFRGRLKNFLQLFSLFHLCGGWVS